MRRGPLCAKLAALRQRLAGLRPARCRCTAPPGPARPCAANPSRGCAGQAWRQWFHSSWAPMWSSCSTGRRSQARPSCAGSASRFFASASQLRRDDIASAVQQPLAMAQFAPSPSRCSTRGRRLSALGASAGGNGAVGMDGVGSLQDERTQHRNRVRLAPSHPIGARSRRQSRNARAFATIGRSLPHRQHLFTRTTRDRQGANERHHLRLHRHRRRHRRLPARQPPERRQAQAACC